MIKHLIFLPLAMALFLMPGFLYGQGNPIELGRVSWLRSLEEARQTARKSSKPILILFQEIPGCQTCRSYGSDVLSHPLVVEAISDYFVPLAIHNNKPGEDKRVLDLFGEPSWNNPVIRIVDADLKAVTERISGNYTKHGLMSRINAALIKSGKRVPAWMEILEEEFGADARGTEKAYIGMYCFWSGEKHYGRIEGVISTRAGFMGGSEVVEVEYRPDRISLEQLLRRGMESGNADRLFVGDIHQKSPVGTIETRRQGPFREDPELKYYLYKSNYRFLPMTRLQAARVNAALGEGRPPESYLSPGQCILMDRIRSGPSRFKKNLIGKDFANAWSEFEAQ